MIKVSQNNNYKINIKIFPNNAFGQAHVALIYYYILFLFGFHGFHNYESLITQLDYSERIKAWIIAVMMIQCNKAKAFSA